MTDVVKRDRQAERRAETEARLVVAASELFVERGYAATTLTDVAERAGVAPRTLYLRFATKTALLLRCIGAAIVGDAESTPLAQRDWMRAAMEAPTLNERIDRMAAVTARLMDRAAPLIAVAQQAAGVEPEIAAMTQAGRQDTRRTVLEFWASAKRDRLLPKGTDLEWLGETATALAHAETYLLLQATTDWDIRGYERWLATSWRRLVSAATPLRP